MQCSNLDLPPLVSLPDVIDKPANSQQDACADKALTMNVSQSASQLQSTMETLGHLQPTIDTLSQYQPTAEPMNQMQSSLESVTQLQPSVLNDISLMYLLQPQQQVSVSNVDSTPSSSAMMMMSPATLQSLLVSQVVAAMQHPGVTPVVSQGSVGTSSVSMQLVVNLHYLSMEIPTHCFHFLHCRFSFLKTKRSLLQQ